MCFSASSENSNYKVTKHKNKKKRIRESEKTETDSVFDTPRNEQKTKSNCVKKHIYICIAPSSRRKKPLTRLAL